MKRKCLALIIAAIALSAGIALAAEKSSTGVTNGNRYRDSRYGFTFDKYDNWKYGKIETETSDKPRGTRFILTQKSVAVPTEYLQNEDKFLVPVIGVFVDTTTMPLAAYAAQLADRRSKRPSRKELVKDFSILGRGDFIDQRPVKLDGGDAIVQQYRQNYEVQLYNRLKDQYKLKEDAILGDLYLTKRGDIVYVLHLTCERAIYRTVNEEAAKIINSVDFDPPADTTQGEPAGKNDS